MVDANIRRVNAANWYFAIINLACYSAKYWFGIAFLILISVDAALAINNSADN